jgi:hypothetical protein
MMERTSPCLLLSLFKTPLRIAWIVLGVGVRIRVRVQIRIRVRITISLLLITLGRCMKLKILYLDCLSSKHDRNAHEGPGQISIMNGFRGSKVG